MGVHTGVSILLDPIHVLVIMVTPDSRRCVGKIV